MSDTVGHYLIPWPVFRGLVRWYRKTFGTIAVPDQTHLRTEATIEQLRRTFGQAHFVKNWVLSYHYAGEDLNMRRPDYDASSKRPWKQTHIRGFDEGDHRLLHAHFELEPTEYPDAHLHEEEFDLEEGLQRTADVLDEAGIDFEVIV